MRGVGSNILWQTVWTTVLQTAWMAWDLEILCVGEVRSQRRSVRDADVKMLVKHHELKTVRLEQLLGQVYKTVLPSVMSQDGVL